MSLNVWFKDDLRSVILAGIVMAIETTTANGAANVEHIEGVLAMAKHQSMAFGICWPTLITDARAALGSGFDELLDGRRQVIEG